jgi:anti-sigma B factor antagonist
VPAYTIPQFELSVHPNRSRVLVRLEGELDLATAPQLAQTFDELRDVGWDAIALDLSDADFVDSTGLRTLLETQARARREGWRFELRGRSRGFERLLTVTGLDDWFTRA